ncbi:MAG: hypothetical protein CML44_02945 [Rhodobacteraceae bacterium]|nr:hypothetical protein [Paracoccaceae bacterium]|tara:strand:+ start:1876 stop:2478 length:603 start_codon:yes stop_codon:yes gene_type:complete
MPAKLITVENGRYKTTTGTDLLASYPDVVPSVGDSFLLMDESDAENLKTTTLREILEVAIIDGYVSGVDPIGFNTSTTPTALTTFNSLATYYSSSGVLVRSPDDTGMTTNAPLRYDVSCTITVRTANSADFFAQIYAGGLPCGEVQDISGAGNSKAVASTIQAYTHLLSIGDKIELRVWDSGEPINSIITTMKVRFAGAD